MYIIKPISVQGRKNQNQDRYSFDKDSAYAILADGIGGRNGGYEAALQAVTWTQDQLNELVSQLKKGKISEGNITDALEHIVKFSNETVIALSERIEDYKEMGTTLDVVFPYGDNVYFAHVGDGEINHYRKGIETNLTTEHSYGIDVVGKDDPKRFRLNLENYVGSEKMFVDTGKFEYLPGDIVTLQTDGVSKYIASDSMKNIFSNFIIGDIEKQIITKLNGVSDHAEEYGHLFNLTPDQANKKLTDDRTIVMIKRL